MGASFLGRGWKFPIEVDPTTGRIRTSEHEEDIDEAIRLILRTSKGERVMRPGFGSGLRKYAFAEMDMTTLRLLESDIKEALTEWEPRIRDVEVTAEQEDGLSGRLKLHISYVVRTTNNLFNQVYPFYLEEGTK
jgi:uncharacterized protein